MSVPEIVAPTFAPVARKDRVEFGSDAWLDAARNYLNERFEQHGASITDERIAVCEQYTAAPPHLADANGQVAFHIVIDRTGVTAARGAISAADVTITADYNKSQWAATAVYEQIPERAARLQRETQHLFGQIHDIRGGFPEVPTVFAVLSGLHDHMARLTEPGKDLAHRIENLGLRQNISELEERGYTVIDNAITDAMADELEADFRRLVAQTAEITGKKARSASMLLARGHLWEEIALHPLIHTIAQHMVGEDCNLGQSIGGIKTQGADALQMHNDPPHPFTGEVCCNLTTIWTIADDFTESSGATVVVPGSHMGNQPPAADAASRAVKILMPKGSVAMWHGGVWHASSVRKDPGERVTIHNTYLRNWVRTFDNYLHIDPEILDRNPVGLSMLCGLDDYYMKNSLAGPDYSRLA